MSRKPVQGQGSSIRWADLVDLFGSFLSVTLVIQLAGVLAAARFDGAVARVALALPIALLLTPLAYFGVPFVLCSFSRAPESDARRQVVFCLRSLHLSWLQLVDASALGAGGVRALAPWMVLAALVASASAMALGAPPRLGPAWSRLREALTQHPQGRLLGRVLAWGLVVGTCVALAASYGRQFLAGAAFEDTCVFGGDQWEYQSVAVNWARGHGFAKFGGLEPFAAYKFHRAVTNEVFLYGATYGFDPSPRLSYYDWYMAAGRKGGVLDFYRSPGYPWLVGMIYRFNGISPAAVKQFQFQLLILVAAFMPLLGFLAWRWQGFFAGLLAGPQFFRMYAGMANEILTEATMTFCAFLMIIVFLIWERRPGAVMSALLGIVLTMAVFVKGFFLPIPFLLGIYVWRQVRRGRVLARNAILAFAIVVAALACWSTYATVKSGHFILLSTQGNAVLPEGNNERVLEKGVWDPTGTRAPGSFYQREDVKALPVLAQVGLYHASHLSQLPLMLWRKVQAGLDGFAFLKMGLIFAGIEMVVSLVRSYARRARARQRDPLPGLAAFVVWSAVLAVMLELLLGVGIVLLLRSFIGVILLLYIPLAILMARDPEAERVSVPAMIIVLFLNSLLVTLMVFGEMRFTTPVDFAFILVTMRYVIHFLGQLWRAGVRLGADLEAVPTT